MIEHLTMCYLEGNLHPKSIVRPELAEKFTCPHGPILIPPFKPIYLNIDKIRINHYWTRDEQYLYAIKIPRVEFLQAHLMASDAWAKRGSKKNDRSTMDVEN